MRSPLLQQQTKLLLFSERVGVSRYRHALVQRGTWLPVHRSTQDTKEDVQQFWIRVCHFRKIQSISSPVLRPQSRQVGQGGLC